MRKIIYFFMAVFSAMSSYAQNTEHFSDESNGSSTFTSNSQVFNITSQSAGPFDVYDDGGSGYGWTGSGTDNFFIDNSTFVGLNPEFTISTSGGVDILLNEFYLYVGDASANLGATGTVTLTGKRDGSTVFTTSSSTHNTSLGTNNGFTYVDMSTYGGSNNSNIQIDQLVISANSNIRYLALDAWKWSIPTAPEINLKGNFMSIIDGDISPSTTDHTDFGSQSVCSGTIVRTFTIENTGTASLSVFSVNITGSHAADFSVSSSPAGSVSASSSTTFQVTFNPSSTGLRSATITVNNSDSDEATYDFAIEGTGVDPEINLQGNSTSIADGDATPSSTDHTDFGSQVVCSGTIVRTFTIQNSGTSILNVTGVNITGTHASDFSITASPAASVSDPGSTTFQVTFNPSGTGTRSATISITNSDCDEATYDFAIQGTGIDPEINLQGNSNSIADGDATPSSTDHTDFGSQDFCSGTIVRTFTIQNTGNSTLNISGVNITGTHAADFSVTSSPSASVAGSSSTTFQVTFNPSAAGTRSASITVSSDDCDEASYDFAIQGTGTDGTPNADAPSNVTACDGYSLPALSTGNYFSGSGGTGTGYSAGNSISSSMTMFVYAVNGSCSDENSFTITINNTPNADAPSNVAACSTYELPALTIGNYFSGSGGTGTAYSAGNNITADMTMFVFAETGTTPNCTNENSFTITINSPVTADNPDDVRACATYELPALSAGNNYYTGAGGTGSLLTAGSNVTSTQTLYVRNVDGACSAENSMLITIFDCIELDASSCNATLTNLSDAIYAETAPGASEYRFKIVHAGSSYEAGTSYANNFFRLSWLTSAPVKYGTTYEIYTSAKVGGLWMPFENACNVTTPATRIQNTYANTTLNNLDDAIYSYAVTGATDYRYEVRKVSDNSLVSLSTRGAADNLFRLSWVTGIEYGETYKIRVTAFVGAAWQTYGTYVNVSTPAATNLASGSCGITLSTISDALYCDALAGASNYRYEIRKQSDNSLVATSVVGNSNTLFRMSWISGGVIQTNTVYSIRVAGYVSGSWTTYGNACNITTPMSMSAKETFDAPDANIQTNLSEDNSLNVYPNPNDGNFKFSSNQHGTYILLNELGQQVASFELEESGVFEAQNIPAGVYLLRHAEGNMIRKVIVR